MTALLAALQATKQIAALVSKQYGGLESVSAIWRACSRRSTCTMFHEIVVLYSSIEKKDKKETAALKEVVDRIYREQLLIELARACVEHINITHFTPREPFSVADL